MRVCFFASARDNLFVPYRVFDFCVLFFIFSSSLRVVLTLFESRTTRITLRSNSPVCEFDRSQFFFFSDFFVNHTYVGA